MLNINFSYITSQLKSYSLEDVILKILYLVISLVVRYLFIKIWNEVKLYFKAKKIIKKLSDSEKIFLKNILLNSEIDISEIDDEFESLKGDSLFTSEFSDIELVSLGGTYLSTGKNKNKVILKLTSLGKRVVGILSN